MTTFQDPQPQSRRAVRQSERGDAAEQPAQPSFGQQPPASPQHFAQPESSRDMWDTTARRAAQLPPAASRPENPASSGRRSAAPSVPLAEPLTYSTQSKTPAPSYDAQTFRTRADTSTTSEQFKVRDFSPEGRRSAQAPDRSWGAPTPAVPSTDLDYHTEAREADAPSAPIAEVPLFSAPEPTSAGPTSAEPTSLEPTSAEATSEESTSAEPTLEASAEPTPTVAFALPDSNEPAAAESIQPDELPSEPELQPEPEAQPQAEAVVPAPVEQVRPVERTVTRRQLRAMQQAEEASLNSQVPELVPPPAPYSAPISSVPAAENPTPPVVRSEAPQVVESSPFEALFRRTPATETAAAVPIDFPPVPRSASEPVVAPATSQVEAAENADTRASDLAQAISEFDSLTASQQALANQPRSAEPGTWTPPTGHWSTQADQDDDFADNAVNRRIGSGHTATNALVLPSIPLGADIRGPLTGTGEIVLTGSIDLPQTLASTGQSDRFDSGIDDLFDLSDAEITSTDSSPVRAIRAVSTHNSGHGVTHTQKPKGTKALTVLLIAASSMAVVVAGLLVAAFAFNVF